MGRFLTKDPLGPQEGGDVNPYWYVGNNPVNFTDPTGLKFEFQDTQSERLFYQMRNNANPEAMQMLDRLEANKNFTVNVRNNALTDLVAGSAGYTYKDGNSANILLSNNVFNAFAGSGQGLLLHETVHADQIMRGVSPVNGKLPETDPVRMQRQHQRLPCPK